MATDHRIILDTAELQVELLNGRALCRSCTIHPEGSIAELDLPGFSCGDAQAFAAHLLSHGELLQPIPAELTSAGHWKKLLA